MMYLELSVLGHLTIFVTRTHGPFWSIRPAKILLFAVLGTQALATFFTVSGIFMHPIPWYLAALVWVTQASGSFSQTALSFWPINSLTPQKRNAPQKPQAARDLSRAAISL